MLADAHSLYSHRDRSALEELVNPSPQSGRLQFAVKPPRGLHLQLLERWRSYCRNCPGIRGDNEVDVLKRSYSVE
jgi:hypothetical protein